MTVEISGFRLGIRTNTISDGNELASMLGPLVVDDDQAPSNFSVIYDDDQDGMTKLHHLYRGHRHVARSRRKDVIAHALVSHLNDLAVQDFGSLLLTGIGFVRQGGIVVAPGIRAEAASLAGSRLARAAIRTSDAPRLRLQLPGQVSVPAMNILLQDGTTFDCTEDADGPIAGPGEYVLKGLILPRYDQPTPPTQASGVARLLGALEFQPSEIDRVLDFLIEFTSDIGMVACDTNTRRIDRSFIATVSSLLDP